MTEDEHYTDEELAQARSLAQLLSASARKPTGADASVADALETAALLRAMRSPALSETAAQAVLARAETRIESRRSQQRHRLIALSSAGLLGSAAALLLWLTPIAPTSAPASAPASSERRTTAPEVALSIPQAPLELARFELTAAQREWLHHRVLPSQSRLESQLAVYRRAHLAALAERYTP